MRATRQFLLMLWKSFLQRKRQPFLLFLEFILPCVMMLIVVMVRYAAPPDDPVTCHYQPRSMPSSGFSFLQDFICNMDNKCFENESAALAYKSQAPASSFYQAVAPLYENSAETIEALEGLEETTGVLRSLADTLNSEEVQALIAFEPKLGNFFRDQEVVKNFLVDNDYLTEETAEALLDSSLNITKLVTLSGTMNLRSYVCEPEKLSSLLIFPSDGVAAEEISRQMCAINESLVPDITNMLLRQLDVTAIIEIINDLASAQGDYTTAHMIEDLAQMAELLAGLDSVQGVLGDLHALAKVGDWVRRVGDFVQALQENGTIEDLAVFGGILEDIGPDLTTWFPNSPVISQLNGAFQYAQIIMNWFNDEIPGSIDADGVTLRGLLPSDADVTQLFAPFSLSDQLLERLLGATIDLQQLGAFITAVSMGATAHQALCDGQPGFEHLLVTEDDEELQTIVGHVTPMLCDPDTGSDTLNALADYFAVQQLIDRLEEVQRSPADDIDWRQFVSDAGQFVESAAGVLRDLQPLISMVTNGTGTEQLWRSLGAAATGLDDVETLDDVIGALLPTIRSVQDVISNLDAETRSELDNSAHRYLLALDIVEELTQQIEGFVTGIVEYLGENEEFTRLVLDVLEIDTDVGVQMFAGLLSQDKLEALLEDQDLLNRVVCDERELTSFLGVAGDSDSLRQISARLCSYGDYNDVLQTVSSIFNLDAVQQAIETLTHVIEEDIRVDRPLNVTHIYHRSWEVLTSFSASLATDSGPAWQDVTSALGLTDEERKRLERLVDDVVMRYSTATYDSGMLDSLTELQNGMDGQTEIQTTLAYSAAIIKWLNDNSAFLFDATQWSLGRLLPGDDLTSQLRMTLNLTSDLVYAFLNTRIDNEKLSEFIQNLVEGQDVITSFCSPSFLLIFDAETSQEHDRIEEIQEKLCSGEVNQNEALEELAEIFKFDELLDKLESLADDNSVNWEELADDITELITKLSQATTTNLESLVRMLTTEINIDSVLDRLVSALNLDRSFEDLKSALLPIIRSVQDVISNLDAETRSELDNSAHRYLLALDIVEELTQQIEGFTTAVADYLAENGVFTSLVRQLFDVDPALAVDVLAALMSPDKVEALLGDEDLLSRVLCDPQQLLSFLELTDDYANVPQITQVLCSYVPNFEDILQRISTAFNSDGLEEAIGRLVEVLEEDTRVDTQLNATYIYHRSWDVLTSFSASLVTDADEAWGDLYAVWDLTEEQRENIDRLIDLLVMRYSTAAYDPALMESLVTGLREGTDGQTGGQTDVQAVLAYSATILAWLNDNSAFLFDAGEWNLGNLLPGDDLASELKMTLNLTSDLVVAFLNTPINNAKLIEFIEELTQGGDVIASFCSRSFLRIFDSETSQEEDRLEEIQGKLCDGSVSQDRILQELAEAFRADELLEKLETRADDTSVDWEEVADSLTEFITKLWEADTTSLETFLSRISTDMGFEEVLERLASTINWNATYDDVIKMILPYFMGTTTASQDEVSRMIEMYAHTYDVILDIISMAAENFLGFGGTFQEVLEENSDFRDFVTELVDENIGAAPLVLSRLTNPVTVQELLDSGDLNSEYLCDVDALRNLLELDDDVMDIGRLRDMLCGRDVTGVLTTLRDSFEYDVIQDKVNEALAILSGDNVPSAPVNYEQLYTKTMGVYNNLTMLVTDMTGDPAWSEIQTLLGLDDADPDEYADFVNALALTYVNSTSASLTSALGEQVEESEYWESVAPMLKAGVTLVNMIYDTTDHLQTLLTGATGDIIETVIANLPQILESATTLVQDQAKLRAFIEELSREPVETLCDHDKLRYYLDGDLDVAAIQDLLCDMDVIDRVEEEILDIYVTVPYAFEITFGYIGATNGDTYDKNIDWEALYTGAMDTVTIATRWYSDESPWLIVTQIDTQLLAEAGMEFVQALMDMSDSNYLTTAAESFEALESTVVAIYGQDTWDQIVYYVYAVDQYVDVVVGYAQDTADDGIQLDNLLGDSGLLTRLVGEEVEISEEVLDTLSTASLNVERLLTLLLSQNLMSQELCRDIDLEELFTFDDDADIPEVQELLCGIDVQRLVEELLETPYLAPVRDLVELLTEYDPSLVPADYKINVTALAEKVLEVVDLYSRSEASWDDVLGQLDDLLQNAGLDIDTQGVVDRLMEMDWQSLDWWAELADRILATSGDETAELSEEARMILFYMDRLAEFNLRVVHVTDLEGSLESMGLEGLKRVLRAYKATPALVNVFVDAATGRNTINPAVSALLLDWETFCDTQYDASVRLTSGDSGNVTVSWVQDMFCDLDFDLIGEDMGKLVEYVGEPLEGVFEGRIPDEVNITAVIEKTRQVQHAWQQLLDSGGSQLQRFLHFYSFDLEQWDGQDIDLGSVLDAGVMRLFESLQAVDGYEEMGALTGMFTALFEESSHGFMALFRNGEALQEWYDDVISWAVLTGYRAPVDLLTRDALDFLSGVPEVGQWACDGELDRLLEGREAEEVRDVADVLCTHPPEDWYTELESRGYDWRQIYAIAETLMTQLSLNDIEIPATWSEINANLVRLVEALETLESLEELEESLRELDSVDTLFDLLSQIGEASIPVSLELLQRLDSTGPENRAWRLLRLVFRASALVTQYANTQLDNLEDDRLIAWSDVFPVADGARTTLEEYLSPDAVSALLASAVSPRVVRAMFNLSSWQAIVCDPQSFEDTFDLRDDVDALTVQTELCQAARSRGQDFLQDLLRQSGVRVLIDQIRSLESDDTSGTGDPFEDFFSHLETLIANVERIAGREEFDDSDWSRVLGAILEVFNQSSSAGYYADVCTSSIATLDQLAFSNSLVPFLSQFQLYLRANNAIMMALPAVNDVICKMNESSLVELYLGVKDSGLIEAVVEFVELFTSNPATPEFDCGVYIDVSEEYIRLAVDWPELGFEEGWQCLIDSTTQNLTALSQLDDIILLLGEFESLVDALDVDFGVLEALVPYLNMTLNAAVRQNPIYAQLRNIVMDVAEFTNVLQTYTNMTLDVIDDLLRTYVDLTLSDIWNLSDEELAELLCDPESVDRVFDLPDDVDLDLSLLSDELCAARAVDFVADLRSLVDMGAVIRQLYSTAATYSLDTDWLRQLYSDVSRMLSSLADLFELVDMMANINLQSASLDDTLAALETLLRTSGIDVLATNINVVIESFKGLVDDEFGQQVLTDLQIVVDGLRSLYFFQRGLNVTVRDIVEDPAALQDYLVDILGLSPDVARSFLDARLSFIQLSQLADTFDLNALVCDPAELSTLITPSNDSSATVADISRELCALDSDEIESIVSFLVDELELGDIFAQFVSLNPEDILKNAGLDIEDLQSIVDILTPLEDTFNSFGAEFSALTGNDVDFIELVNILEDSDSLSDKKTVESLSQLMCGRKDAFNLRDSFGLSGDEDTRVDSSRKKRSSGDRLTEWQLYELSRFNTGFCRSLYRELQRSTEGQVVWKFMKPFMQGIIYFAPDNEATRPIMEEAEAVFKVITEVQSILKAYLDNVDHIAQLANSTDDVYTIEQALENPLINQFVTDLIGSSPSRLLDSLRTLQSISPENLQSITSALQLFHDTTKCVSVNRLEGRASWDAMKNDVEEDSTRNELLAAVVFDDMDDYGQSSVTYDPCRFELHDVTLPKHIKYTIRMENDNLPPTHLTKDPLWAPGPNDNFAEDARYFRGFIQLQSLIDSAIIKLQTGCDEPVTLVETNQFPYPCFSNDPFARYVTLYVFPIMMVFMWLVIIGSATSKIVADKQMALEETMKSMGLRSRINWLAWFLSSFLVTSVLSIVIVLFLKLGNIFPHSDWGIMIIFLLIFSFSTLMLSFAVSAFFTNAVLATLVAIVVYGAMFLPFFIVIGMREDLPYWAEVLVSFACNTAFSHGSQMIALQEQRGEGIQWHNMDEKVLYAELTFDWMMYMMLIDGVIYALIGWYACNVFPGKYGIAQPWYFPLLPRYWGCTCFSKEGKSAYKLGNAAEGRKRGFGQYEDDGAFPNGEYHDKKAVWGQRYKSVSEVTLSPESPDPGPESLPMHSLEGPSQNIRDTGPGERDPNNLPVGISMHHVKKRFGRRSAINDLNVNVYQDQITALLGHNGAGKTTCINVVTGMLMPSAGAAYVNGRSVAKHTMTVREDLGVCPQQNILFHYMTVYEHLDFYGALKGKQTSKERRADIRRLVEKVGLQSHIHVKASDLSGGQKRRLQVAIAFVGGPRVIILDEPTSGVDSMARRYIWDLIIDNKRNRTILLCTHHLDEADILADRVLIIHQGKLLSKGSPLYLKNEFGCGYQLTMAKELLGQPGASVAYNTSHCKSSDVLDLLKRHVIEAELLEEHGSEMTFILPTNRGQRSYFSAMFDELDAKREELSVASYGVSDTTLEEVFIKITHAATKGRELDPETMRKTLIKHMDESEAEDDDDDDEDTRNGRNGAAHTGAETDRRPTWQCLHHFLALLFKHFVHTTTNWRSYLSFVILPMVLIVFAMLCMKYKPQTTDEPSLELAPEIYRNTHAFFRFHDTSPLLSGIERDLARSEGLAASCLPGSEYKCNIDGRDFTTPDVTSEEAKEYDRAARCKCEDDTWECPAGSGGFPPAERRTRSRMNVYNLTDNIFDTEKHIKQTFNDFIDDRYGGLVFSQDGNQSLASVWYNNKGFHSVAAYHSAATNAILRGKLNRSHTDPTGYGITTINHPLEGDFEDFTEETLLQKMSDIGIAMILLVGFSFVVAGHSVYLVKERTNKEKRLQLIYGVSLSCYWAVAFLWQMVTSLIPVGIALGIMRAFNLEEYAAGQNLAAHAVLLLLYCFAAVPTMYLMIRFCKYVHNAYLLIFLYNFFVGLATTMCMFLFYQTSYEKSIREASDVMEKVFLIFAPFCLGDGSIRITHNEYVYQIKKKFVFRDTGERLDPFSFEDGIGWHLVALGIQGVVFFVFNMVLEGVTCRRTNLNNGHRDLNYKEDSDVSMERQRVSTGEARGDTLVVHNLRKAFYRGVRKVLAVDNLSIGIPKGECFGLLGVNGAGKTTTFNTITGEISPTKGAIKFRGRTISSKTSNMEGEVGYCPQVNALDDFMTGRAMLNFYCKLKGVADVHGTTEQLLADFGLTQHANVLTKNYSGGTKRKLQTAISLVGSPQLVLLDEPTAGIDSVSKRLIWRNLQRVIRDNRTVVLTSHSVSECEALCTRFGFMVNGRFVCLGSAQHLKNKFGHGYMVTVRVGGDPPDLERVCTFMETNFPQCYLKEAHLNQLEFTIQDARSLSLGSIFGRLEAHKHSLAIQEYSLSQTSIERVFMNFSRLQGDGTEDDRSDTASNLTSNRTSVRGYDNQLYHATPQRTPTSLPENGGRRVGSSLRSIPGYRQSNVVASDDVNISLADEDTLKKRAVYGSESFGADREDPEAGDIDLDEERYVSQPRPMAASAQGGSYTEVDAQTPSTSSSPSSAGKENQAFLDDL